MTENDSPTTNSEHPGNCIVRKVGDHYAVLKIGRNGLREPIRDKPPSLDDAYRIARSHLDKGGRVWYQDGGRVELYRVVK